MVDKELALFHDLEYQDLDPLFMSNVSSSLAHLHILSVVGSRTYSADRYRFRPPMSRSLPSQLLSLDVQLDRLLSLLQRSIYGECYMRFI